MILLGWELSSFNWKVNNKNSNRLPSILSYLALESRKSEGEENWVNMYITQAKENIPSSRSPR